MSTKTILGARMSAAEQKLGNYVDLTDSLAPLQSAGEASDWISGSAEELLSGGLYAGVAIPSNGL